MSSSKKMGNERKVVARGCRVLARQAASGGLSVSAYNPSSGSFHTMETLSPESEAGYLNGRFRIIDESDDAASSHGGGADVDCMSSSGSCSGESEDQLHLGAKDKTLPAKSGMGGVDKRDKIRGKNERKHQRQKERRAKELRDKCNGYLMSCKLEGLSQQLVAMGFSHERATMSLIVNNAHVEQSIAWLLEGGEGQVHEDWSLRGSLKIDISDELGQLLEIENRHKFSRPDIERAVVSCEGDIEKALDSLQSRNVSTVTEKDCKIHSRITDAKHPVSLPVLSASPTACQSRGNAAIQPPHQMKKFGAAIPSFEGRHIADSCVAIGGLSRNSVQTQVSKPQSLVPGVERLTQQSVPVKMVPHLHSYTPVSSTETGLVFGFGAPDPRLLVKDHFKNAPVKELSHKGLAQSMLQSNPQPLVASKNNPTVAPAFFPSSWAQEGVMEAGSSSSVLHVNDETRMKGLASIKHALIGSEMGPADLADRISSLLAFQAESQRSPWYGVGRGFPYDIGSASSALPAIQSECSSGKSCGVFTGWGGGLSQPSVDWSSGPIRQCDYRNIDWSMNLTRAATQGSSNQPNVLAHQMKTSNQWDFEGERRFKVGGRAAGFPTDSSCSGLPGAGLQDRISINHRNYEWTSPFAGKALFNFPQAVSSPFL